MAFLTLAIVLIVALAAMLAFVVYMMARMLLRPPRMNDAKALWVLKRLTPADLGLAYENCSFIVRDERTGQNLKLAAWWIPQSNLTDRTVVLVHGYADAKVGAIAWAPMWRSLGFNVLAIDLRAHGESDGVHSTAGYFERHDFNQVLNQLRAQRPRETAELVIFGVSLGAAVALAALAEREEGEDIVDALVCECPYASYANAAIAHAKKMNLPFRSLQPLSIRLAEWMSGARFDEVSPAAMIRRARCPLLVIQSCDDVLVPRQDMDAIVDAVRARGDAAELWAVPEAGHVLGICADPASYSAHIETFLQRMKKNGQPYHGFSTRAEPSARVENP